ncbi:unnamed protein product [Phytophthora fragariaefolia]|uniref:Unnamed protein product n=1 Tax=Phytophthora fragariaefolia TaxID=1490495 RepID=A0A9W6TIT4_9STRA|nr:unnamed protein product [Phytophthora fragariaefolia]
MFNLGVLDSDGVETKYITRKELPQKLPQFLRLSGKDAPEHDFMIVLTNDTIKRIEQDFKRNDEPDNVCSEKAKRFLHTDWESFNNNPAYHVIIDYKDNVFKPELPQGLPMEGNTEHRIDVKDPNIAMYRQQWSLSPEQKAEIDKWNFKELKQRLADTPVLYLPDFTQQMHFRTDVSQFAVGGVLFHVEDGVERPIAYTSRKMNSAELKYPTQQQELLVIVYVLAAFRIYCLDRPPMDETDHKSLEGIFQQKKANRRLARWYDVLAEYQPVFAYLPGAKNGIADALSRRPDLKPETKAFHDLLVPSFNATKYQLRVMEIKPTSDLIKSIIA